MQLNTSKMTSCLKWWLGFHTYLYLQSVLCYPSVTSCSTGSCWYQYSWKLLFHPDGHSILDIFQNPDGHGWFVWYNDDKNQHCWRERAQFVPQWAWRKRQRCICIQWSNTSSDALPIQGYNSRLCMFSFYWIHPTSINKTDGGPSSEDWVTNKVSVTTHSIFVHHRSHLSLGV